MISLVLRQLRKAWVVQVALVILFASSVVIFILYSAYVARESSSVNTSIEGGIPAGLFVVRTPVPENIPDLSRTSDEALITVWWEGEAKSSLGSIACAFVTEHPAITSLASPGSAVVPKRLAEKFGLAVGDVITIREDNRETPLRVLEIHDGTPLGLNFDFGGRVLVFTGATQQSTAFLYRQVHSDRNRVLFQLRSMHPGSVIEDSASSQSAARALVKNNYAGIIQAQTSLVLFITLAFLTAKMLSFLDGRRTTAILKAVGLRNGEVAGVIAADALLAPTVGVALGVLLGWMALRVLAQQGTGLLFTGGIAVGAVACVLPAVLVGTVVPARLAQVATVIALLFQRSIPLFHDKVDNISKHWPQLEEHLAKGIRFLKLDTSGGDFEGILFRKLGDTVKRGEVVAYATSWWGLKVREYVAPIDGIVAYYQRETGFIGIGSADQPDVEDS